MKKNILFLKISYIFFAFCILIFAASSFFMDKDILLIPAFLSFVCLSAISAVRSGLEGDRRAACLFCAASILFVFITAFIWRDMGLVPGDFTRIF